MPKVGRPSSLHSQRVVRAMPEMIDVNCDEVLTLEDKAEVEELLADMMFAWWKKSRGIK